MVREIYQGKFFMHASVRSILQKSKRLKQISKLLKSTRSPSNPKYATPTFTSNNQAQWLCLVELCFFTRVLGYLSNFGGLAGLQFYQNYRFAGKRNSLIYINFSFDTEL